MSNPALRAAVLALALLATGFAFAAGATTRLEDMTSTEVRDAIAAGATTVIVPVGGTEQNGAHMALGKHNLRAAAFADRIAARLGRTLVAPVIRYVPEGRVSPPTGHMRFAGTISVPEAAFAGIVTGAAESLRQHGFRDIVLIGDSGDYQALLRGLAVKLDRQWAPAVRVHHIDAYYRASTAGFRELLRARGIAGADVAAHAGIADTALLMAVDPSAVRSGQPPLATASLGQLGAELVVEQTVAAIREAIAAPRARTQEKR